MHPWLKLTLCVAVTILLAWGVVRSLARSAPITADWGGLGFVTVTLALMVLGVGTTCVCLLRRRPACEIMRGVPRSTKASSPRPKA